MAEQTGIQWTDSTWNIVTGCTRVSPGCARCYIERTPPFRMSGRKFANVGGGEATTGVTLHRDRLAKVPRGPKIFTPSLGDLFHEEVPRDFIFAAFDVMAHHRDRIFQVLTKRPERARELLAPRPGYEPWKPLPNVWLGVSIENSRYTWRADVLREIPAAVRFISAEPLLGSLFSSSGVRIPPVSPAHGYRNGEAEAARDRQRAPLDLTGIDWVIIGGESGPKARPFHLEHAREIVNACLVRCLWCSPPDGEKDRITRLDGALTHPGTGVPCARPAVFVKQLGALPVVEGVITMRSPLLDRKGGDMDEWPADLRIREFPRTAVRA